MKILNIYILIFFVGISLIGNAQVDSTETDDYAIDESSIKNKDKVKYGMEIGAMIGTSGNFSTYYKPKMSFLISPRFAINTGFMYVNTVANNFPVFSEYGYQTFSGNLSQYSAFIEGQYKMSDKLTVAGAIYYDFTSYNTQLGFDNNNSLNAIDNVGYSASFTYKVSDSFQLSGEIRSNASNSPFNRYNNFGVGSSFMGRNSFGDFPW